MAALSLSLGCDQKHHVRDKGSLFSQVLSLIDRKVCDKSIREHQSDKYSNAI